MEACEFCKRVVDPADEEAMRAHRRRQRATEEAAESEAGGVRPGRAKSSSEALAWRTVWARGEPVIDNPPTLRAANATIAAGLRRQAAACRGLLGFEVVVEGPAVRVVGR